MLAEKWYDANFDQDLINERARAKDICFELNHTRPSAKIKKGINRSIISNNNRQCKYFDSF